MEDKEIKNENKATTKKNEEKIKREDESLNKDTENQPDKELSIVSDVSLGKRLLSGSSLKKGISVSVKGRTVNIGLNSKQSGSAWKKKDDEGNDANADSADKKIDEESFPDLLESTEKIKSELGKEKDKRKNRLKDLKKGEDATIAVGGGVVAGTGVGLEKGKGSMGEKLKFSINSLEGSRLNENGPMSWYDPDNERNDKGANNNNAKPEAEEVGYLMSGFQGKHMYGIVCFLKRGTQNPPPPPPTIPYEESSIVLGNSTGVISDVKSTEKKTMNTSVRSPMKSTGINMPNMNIPKNSPINVSMNAQMNSPMNKQMNVSMNMPMNAPMNAQVIAPINPMFMNMNTNAVNMGVNSNMYRKGNNKNMMMMNSMGMNRKRTQVPGNPSQSNEYTFDRNDKTNQYISTQQSSGVNSSNPHAFSEAGNNSGESQTNKPNYPNRPMKQLSKNSNMDEEGGMGKQINYNKKMEKKDYRNPKKIDVDMEGSWRRNSLINEDNKEGGEYGNNKYADMTTSGNDPNSGGNPNHSNFNSNYGHNYGHQMNNGNNKTNRSYMNRGQMRNMNNTNNMNRGQHNMNALNNSDNMDNAGSINNMERNFNAFNNMNHMNKNTISSNVDKTTMNANTNYTNNNNNTNTNDPNWISEKALNMNLSYPQGPMNVSQKGKGDFRNSENKANVYNKMTGRNMMNRNGDELGKGNNKMNSGSGTNSNVNLHSMASGKTDSENMLNEDMKGNTNTYHLNQKSTFKQNSPTKTTGPRNKTGDMRNVAASDQKKNVN